MILRYAGGREVTLRELQSMGMTSGINALIVGNYLTTLGRSADEDLQMLSDLRMPVGALTGVPVTGGRPVDRLLHRLRIRIVRLPGCGRALDPPRFCPHCGRRLSRGGEPRRLPGPLS